MLACTFFFFALTAPFTRMHALLRSSAHTPLFHGMTHGLSSLVAWRFFTGALGYNSAHESFFLLLLLLLGSRANG